MTYNTKQKNTKNYCTRQIYKQRIRKDFLLDTVRGLNTAEYRKGAMWGII